MPSAGHALPQRPQCATLAVRSASQPLEARPSQSPHPASQVATAHAPAAHAPVAWLGAHARPQPPQCAALVRVSTSQPVGTRRAGHPAGAAVGRRAVELHLAAVGGVHVAVAEARGAHPDGAAPGGADARRARRSARASAGAAVGGAVARVDLAAVGGVSVAVGEARVARVGAAPRGAGDGVVGARGAGPAAAAAVRRVGERLGLAAVAGDGVAVGEGAHARAHGADPVAARGHGVGGVAAEVAPAAARHGGLEVEARARAARPPLGAAARGRAPGDTHCAHAERSCGAVSVGEAGDALVRRGVTASAARACVGGPTRGVVAASGRAREAPCDAVLARRTHVARREATRAASRGGVTHGTVGVSHARGVVGATKGGVDDVGGRVEAQVERDVGGDVVRRVGRVVSVEERVGHVGHVGHVGLREVDAGVRGASADDGLAGARRCEGYEDRERGEPRGGDACHGEVDAIPRARGYTG